MGVLHREDRIVERAVSQVIHLEFLLRLGLLAIVRVNGTAVEDEDEIHHFLGLDRFAEVHQLLHAELLGVATLAVEHLLLVCREFHGHGDLPSMDWNGLLLARDRDRGLLAYLRRVDFHPVAGLDGRDRVLVQGIDGGDSTGNGSTDVDIVDFLADDGRRAVM